MVGNLGNLYGAADAATLCDRYQRKLEAEAAKRNPGPDRMINLRGQRDMWCARAAQADVSAMQSFGERTGLATLYEGAEPEQIVVRRRVTSPTWWYPLAAGAGVLLVVGAGMTIFGGSR